jgi:hydrogenase maturation protein HypF
MKTLALTGVRIHITGMVQGVGFRPFVYGLAMRLGLNGWVRNTSAGVDIQVDGSEPALNEFVYVLKNEYPPLARIDTFTLERIEPDGYRQFNIIHSEPIPGAFIPISPDVSICEDCLTELLDTEDRRFLYPFINCTNCGPRFTIIQDIPYDRPKTTMAPFEMCPQCQQEYDNPLDRRFHAQPVACPRCGPHIWLEEANSGNQALARESSSQTNDINIICMVQEHLLNGKIIGIKGLGGFHLACDATNANAVGKLRQRKLRVDKPFGLMMPDIDTIEKHCIISNDERRLLESRERPIVILQKRSDSSIAPAVAPNQTTLGVMLPYTPLHHLLFVGKDVIHQIDKQTTSSRLSALVMTSGNLSEEPIAYTNAEAYEHLAPLADFFLMHNRDIHTRCDDSVVRENPAVENQGPECSDQVPKLYFLRRSRGYAPDPIRLPWNSQQILAAGPELKNTFCLTKDDYAFVSHHIGDMENYETLRSYEAGIEHFESLFRVNPEMIACDMHPNYLSTRYAEKRAESDNLPLLKIQHHHAHIAACMADNGSIGERPVIGVSLDGTGFGEDRNIWGGEFLISTYTGYNRFAHLAYSPLPGGDSAIKNPYRIALAQLWHNDIDWDDDLPPVKAACGDDLTMLRSMLENNINAPLTSSMGRFFDAVSALIGVRSQVNYEAQAAIELENLVDPNELGAYTFEISKPGSYDVHSDPESIKIYPKPVFLDIIKDLRAGATTPTISAKFHNGLAEMVVEICRLAGEAHGIREVALSGGVWQNMVLLRITAELLKQAGFKTYTHRQVPANDGGLSLGQAAIAAKIYGN